MCLRDRDYLILYGAVGVKRNQRTFRHKAFTVSTRPTLQMPPKKGNKTFTTDDTAAQDVPDISAPVIDSASASVSEKEPCTTASAR